MTSADDRPAMLVIEEEIAAFVRWLEVSKGLRPASIKVYRREVEDWLLAGRPSLQSYTTERGGSPSTVTRRLSAIKAYAKKTRDRDLLAELEDQDRPKRPKGLPRPVKDPDAVLARMAPLFRWIAVFLHETGLRIHEAETLNVSVPPPDPLRITGKGGKDRLVPLTREARQALIALGGKGTGGLKARAVQRHFRKAGCTPHQWRHLLGCELAASGADLGEIQEALGHSNPSTTRGYAAYSTERVRGAQDRRHAAARAGAGSVRPIPEAGR